jgi:hypothetical protein
MLARTHLVPLVQDDIVPQDAAALWRLQAEGVLLILMLINVCNEQRHTMSCVWDKKESLHSSHWPGRHVEQAS